MGTRNQPSIKQLHNRLNKRLAEILTPQEVILYEV
jgi:hypothetical protein